MVDENGKKAYSLLFTIVIVTFIIAFFLGLILGRFVMGVFVF